MWRNLDGPASTHSNFTYVPLPAFWFLHHLKEDNYKSWAQWILHHHGQIYKQFIRLLCSYWRKKEDGVSYIKEFSYLSKRKRHSKLNLTFSVYTFKEFMNFKRTFRCCSSCALGSGRNDSSTFRAVWEQTGDSTSESHMCTEQKGGKKEDIKYNILQFNESSMWSAFW